MGGRHCLLSKEVGDLVSENLAGGVKFVVYHLTITEISVVSFN